MSTLARIARRIFKFFLWLTALVLFCLILFRWVPVPVTPLMLLRLTEGKQPGQEFSLYHDWVPLEKMSPHLIRSAVAAEDQRFMEHYGFDFEAMKKAMDYNRQNKTGRTRGASTISQQTAKNVFLWPSRIWIRKGLEAGFTLLIEGVWGKRRIMEVYLNVIEMGPGIYGAEAASRAYFDKSADELSARQAALIVAAFPNPRERSPDQPSRYLKKRARKIAGMARNLPEESYPQP